ncbi:MAG: arylsulfatase [Bacteroidetes bacterium]|nr:arylsulfatase [Bacteroidota bacterium]
MIIILADDMGYGDLQAFNPKSEVPTPNLNKLSEEGVMFMDAHTPSSICTPTRYGLLTGRYCWRSSLKKGVLKGYDAPLIENDRLTIADYLKGKGYRTGIVGKWHLGLGFQKDETANESEKRFDLSATLYSSPNNNGFDYSFVLPASLDFEPYVYVRNYEVVDTELDSVPTTSFPHFWREGVKSKSLEFKDVMDDFLVEAKNFIEQESKSKTPFFFYFPLTAPHKPVIPTEKFVGISGKGLYGDFVSQIDWTAGEIFRLLEELNIDENTIVIFASDNGSPMYRIDSGSGPDHVTDETLAYYNASSHKANSLLRGIKGDAYEGGHRVPFIVRWPEKLSGGIRVNETICLTDIFETIIDITGGVKPEGNGEDSYSFFPILNGQTEGVNRLPVIHHSGGKGMFAIRKDNWKMILGNGSGARTKPVGTPFQEPYQLYDLEKDLTESNNMIDKETEMAKILQKELFEIKGPD